MWEPVWIGPCGNRFCRRVSRDSRPQQACDYGSRRSPQRPRYEPRETKKAPEHCRIAEARIAREKFIATKPGEGHFQPDFPGRPRYTVCIDSVHGRLVKARNRFINPSEHGGAIEWNLGMLCAASLRDLAGQRTLVVLEIGRASCRGRGAPCAAGA